MRYDEIFTVNVVDQGFFPSQNDVENTIRLLDKYQITAYNYPSEELNGKIISSIQDHGFASTFKLLCTPIRISLHCEGGEYLQTYEHTPREWLQILEAFDSYPRPYRYECSHFLQIQSDDRQQILSFESVRAKLIEKLQSSGLTLDCAKAWLQIQEFDWEDKTRLKKLNTWDYIEANPVFNLPLSLAKSFQDWYSHYSYRYEKEGAYGLCLSMYFSQRTGSPVQDLFCIMEEKDGECIYDRNILPEFKKKYKLLVKELRTTLQQERYVDYVLQRRTMW